MPDEYLTSITIWIEDHLQNYTGVINIENMGNVIIDFHLRMSTQFVDLYCSDWIEAVINLYERGIWDWDRTNQYGVSYVHWTDKDEHPIIDDFDLDNGTSIQLMFEEGKKLSEIYNIGSYRSFTINGKSKQKVLEIVKRAGRY